MSILVMSAEEQREFLRGYVLAPHVVFREDPFRVQFDDLIAECCRRDEVGLGCALIALTVLRAVGLQHEAAGAMMSLIANRGREGGAR